MISLEEAKERLFASITPLPAERVPLYEAPGRYCAEQTTSEIDLPRFDNSAMDGYAVRSEDIKTASEESPVRLRLIGRIGAGEKFGSVISAGTCLRLFTGSILPEGADAVVMQEDVNAENDHTRFVESVKPFENVRLKGEDIGKGTVVTRAGERLTATRIGLLAATGHAEVAVRTRPRVTLMATGDELVETRNSLVPGKIFESNRVLIRSLLEPLGIQPVIHALVPDRLKETMEALRGAFADTDVVITTGGVSVGEFDFVKEAFAQIGGTIDHWKVAIRPGKPFVFGTLGTKFLLGLPGNPVSALVTFLVLVRPGLLRMMGARNCELPKVAGILTTAIANPGDRRHFVRCQWNEGNVTPAGRQGSHMIGALSAANCLVDVSPATRLEAGAKVTAQLWELPES